ncbi:MAG: two component transcriptional regulator, winged helix family [Bacillales bacterium]|jgi:two-component system alkaline phosphatase synthesis response regulator PhoP|nr:two component transcriptional regulator, winged helix family [Bacillales bacterium]
MNKILVVEDEFPILTLLKYNLEQAGFEVQTADDGVVGLEIALVQKFDVILLDIMLPSMLGTDICKNLRERKNYTPVLMLSALGEETDKLKGLDIGADDYMTKPFSPREVVAKVKAMIRRTEFSTLDASSQKKSNVNPNHKNGLTIGDVEVIPDLFEAYFRGNKMDLTKKEFELLLFLMRQPGVTFNREKLLKDVWNYDFAGDTRIVDVHISNLREKIESDTRNPKYIKTVRGFGYKMEVPLS